MNNREIEKNEALARIKGLENELANGWQRDRIKALEDRVEQLEVALRPFITHYADWMDRYPDSNETSTFPRHTYGDIRRARAALDQSSPPKDTAESVAAEARYFEDHADRFAEAHKGIARAALDQSSPPAIAPCDDAEFGMKP